MTILEAAQWFGVCDGRQSFACGLTPEQHWKGTLDPFLTVHYSPRRMTRRALRNLLLLVAKRDRLPDPEFLNDARYDYLYLHLDNVAAARMAMDLGVRLPARLSRLDRLRCLQLARRKGIRLSKRSATYAWAHEAV